ncbi:hypothetical protein HSRCO_0272 [Halanaeroarchaeum sp. HSR-CO]|uniref:hypothetical protein n=1 Tax=Halanaeroarchaeum sp. HSR-CO TaxID=2866382 RepID=UPI00217CE791|nr:hypothetical protein [Halanaeroarchaeum sp. HSR-CO]UWG46571.1 hypothetical protein HSRCO_0272 [Halanaeroarchaeum sp. HSR-CO]
MSGTYSDDWDGGLVGNLPEENTDNDSDLAEESDGYGGSLEDAEESEGSGWFDGWGTAIDPETGCGGYAGCGLIAEPGEEQTSGGASEEAVEDTQDVISDYQDDADHVAEQTDPEAIRVFVDETVPDIRSMPWWVYVGLLLILLIALRPYASLGAEVAG